jgi:HAD superfamily hydrolase (TIGR01509 family)
VNARRGVHTTIDTVVFDMDGVIFDTEQVWHAVRRDFAIANGGHWTEADQTAVMGDNSRQWSLYMRDKCEVPLPPEEILEGVLRGLRERYRHELVVYPGAREAVAGLASRFRLGIASSSPRELIETALDVAGMRQHFLAVVSSDEVAHGKPNPDVYLAACARLQAEPACAAAVEDSTNGIRAAAAAGLAVIAIPNKEFPPSPEVVSLAREVLVSIADLTVGVVTSLSGEADDG